MTRLFSLNITRLGTIVMNLQQNLPSSPSVGINIQFPLFMVKIVQQFILWRNFSKTFFFTGESFQNSFVSSYSRRFTLAGIIIISPNGGFMIGKLSIGAILFLFLCGIAPKQPTGKKTIEGSWNIVEVQTVKADGQFTSFKPQESQALFAKGRYSFCWTSHKSNTNSWLIADSEKVIRFNQTLVNAGTYTITDSVLETSAEFALSPKFVKGTASFRYFFSGDTLILIGIHVLSPDGVLHPMYAAGSHGVNKLVRIK